MLDEKERVNHLIERLTTLCTPEFLASLTCAVTHDIHVCGECQKCAANAAAARVDLVAKIDVLSILMEAFADLEPLK